MLLPLRPNRKWLLKSIAETAAAAADTLARCAPHHGSPVKRPWCLIPTAAKSTSKRCRSNADDDTKVATGAAANAHRDAEQIVKSDGHCDDNRSDNKYKYDDANTTMSNCVRSCRHCLPVMTMPVDGEQVATLQSFRIEQ